MSRKSAVQAPQAGPAIPNTPEQAVAAWGELPGQGGCFVRNPDGSLVRDPEVHGAPETPAAGEEEA